MNSKKLLYFPACLVLLMSCGNSKKNILARDILADDLDTTINPANDFFEYANGGWIKKNPIPADRSFWGTTAIVYEEILLRLRGINEEAARTNGIVGTADQKIGDFWSSAMDSVKIESTGLKPLQFYLNKINGIIDIKSFVSTIAELEKIESNKLFSGYVGQDEKRNNVMRYDLGQGESAFLKENIISRMIAQQLIFVIGI